MGQPWVPETKEVDDRVFIRLHKWDRGLYRFAIGRSLCFKGDHENIGLVDDLCVRRNRACDELYRQLREEEDDVGDAAGPSNKKPRKGYIRKSRASDCAFLPKTVTIKLPDAQHDDGRVLHGHECLFLTDGIRTSNVFVELTVENLDYIHQFVSLSGNRGRSRKKRARESVPEPTSWLDHNEYGDAHVDADDDEDDGHRAGREV